MMIHSFGMFVSRKCLMLALVISAISLSAIPYTVDWYTTGCDHNIASEGNYILVSSIAQPDSTILGAGLYTLAGGFWYNQVIPVTRMIPVLYITRVNGELMLFWAPALPGYRLEQAPDLSFPEWTIAPLGNPVFIPMTEQVVFFRLNKPE